MPERAVGTTLIIVRPPGFDDGLGLGQRGELMYVQTLVAQLSVKRFNEGMVDGFARLNEVKLDASPISAIFQGPPLELRSMIHGDRAGHCW